MATPAELLQFWFGDLDAAGRSTNEVSARWFRPDPAFDAELGRRFGADVEAALRGDLVGWMATPRDRLAYVLLLDQLTRNLFRGSGRMFAGDDRAVALAEAAMERGDDAELPADLRGFLYMPLMHAEDLARQERSVALFESLAAAAPPAHAGRAAKAADYARRHRDVVARFGRFPHRNAALGRDSTPDEVEFLKQPGSSF